jgi:hypothetical protein
MQCFSGQIKAIHVFTASVISCDRQVRHNIFADHSLAFHENPQLLSHQDVGCNEDADHDEKNQAHGGKLHLFKCILSADITKWLSEYP